MAVNDTFQHTDPPGLPCSIVVAAVVVLMALVLRRVLR